MAGLIEQESVPRTFLRVLGSPVLRGTALACIASMVRNFFFLQYRAAFLPGRIPVSSVDHPLDDKIPFTPSRVGVYLDFVGFWVRMLGFLLRVYRRRALAPVRDFLSSMGTLYERAAEVYGRNLSTTRRPRYLARPRFFLIHLVDPHLMCVPSLHVMVVIRSYTRFAAILQSLGGSEQWAAEQEELRRGAIAITEAVLFVKQHSVNCISAAMYAMTCFDPAGFPPEEAGRFAEALFSGQGLPPAPSTPDAAAAALLRDYIYSLYTRFLSEGNASTGWTTPLRTFLAGPA